MSLLMSTNVSVTCVTSTSFITNRWISHHLRVAGGYKARVRTSTTPKTTIRDVWLAHRIFGL